MDQTSLFFECSLFKEDLDVMSRPFSVKQKELLLSDIVGQQAKFGQVDVEYKCKFVFQESGFDKQKPFIIIPSRNNVELIKYTINNLLENKVDQICNIMIVDDRSTDDYLSALKDKKQISYLRVDNEKGFNFSMLCNIGAYIANKLGCEEIILWNNDLWVDKREYLETVIKKHREDKSTISGTKLLYPLKSFSGSTEDSENVKQHFPNMKDGKWRGTVQFGGGAWAQFPNAPILFSPLHFKRFSQPDNHLVNCDKGETFITGAFHLYDLSWFIKNGGLNPSLSKNFQDVDVCLRASEDNKKVMYYGKDLFFWHDESLTFNSVGEKKNDKQMTSDHVLFGKVWNSKIAKIIL
jgi:GT2 family glycosyltransferase